MWPVWYSQREPYYAFLGQQRKRAAPKRQQTDYQTMASNSTMTNMRGKTYSDFQTNLSQRLMTFYPEGGGFASLWKCPYVYPDALVRAGFIYSGHKDRVHCVFCRKNLSQWEPGDDPRLEHIKHFPDCVGIQYEWLVSQEISDSLTGNQQSRSVGIADAPFTSSALSRRQSSPQKTSEDQYMACESRVASFTRSWPHNSGNLTPQRMALAGFYYSGNLDRVRCYMCNCQLHAWLPDDDPMLEHQKWFPDCPIVKDYERSQASASSNSDMPMATCRGNAMVQEGSVLTEVGQPIQADSFSSVNESDMEELNSLLETLNTSIEDNSTSKQDSVATAGSEEMAVSDSLGVPKGKAPGGGAAVETLCSICLDKDKSIAFIPCGHVACCTDCAYHVNTCPLCRKVIQNRIKIYL